ncbi:peptidoglycan-binding domain-containing protein [Spirillospora sp. CA-255316]
MKDKRAVIAGLAVAGFVAGGTAVALPAAADTQTYYEGYGPHRVLQQGSKGAEVRALQWMLKCENSRKAKPTGVYDSATAREVRNYQIKGHAVQADGKVGAATWHFLYNDRKPIRYAKKPPNDCVRAFQVLLNKFPGGKPRTVRVTGNYWVDTRNKVKLFQKRIGRTQTGQVDAKTFHQLVSKKATG